MKSFTELSKIFLNGILLYVFIIMSYNSVLAQGTFNRNDNYDFRGEHYLTAGGSSVDNFNLFISEDSSDFRKFKLHIKKSRLHLSGVWLAWQYRIDMNNDGTWEQGWTTSNEITVSYTYPNPPNGISATHTVKIEIQYQENPCCGTENRTKYIPVTIFSTPRVYVDSDNNSFIQLRNEDATWKIPVLMVEGFDPLNEKFPEIYYNLTWNLVNIDLYPNGYEVFILNFNNGGRDLRLNAEVLLKAIEKVHEVCPNYKIALAGLSMGGPIGRYALAKKEDEGGVHHVGLFLSYDSPQWWAHVSPDLQDWIKIQNPNEEAISILQANLQSDGAKQMLYYNTYDPNGIYRIAFYNELNGYNGDGYPHQSYNVAVSNGNFIATWGWPQAGRHLMTLKINDQLIKDVPAVQLDCGVGSKITDITMKRYGDIFSSPFINVWYELEIIFNPSYTPTFSSLDLVNPQFNQVTGDITSFERSKFDDFVVQEQALHHHELSEVTRNAIMGWLNKNSNITVNYSLPEGGSVTPDNYQVRILHPIQITVPPKTVNVNGKLITYHFVKWEDGNTSNPRTFYTSHDASFNAIMKGTTLSDDPNAYSSTSQRKFVRTDDGWLLSTYSSMGRIWFESSSDNGTTWKIANNDNKPVDDGEAKLPSICNLLYNYEGFDNRFAIIVYQEKFGSGFKIKAKCYKRWDDQIVYVYQNEVTLASYTSESYSNNANPVLAVDSDRYITIIWEQKSGAAGLYRRNERCNIGGLTSTGSNTKLNYTNSSSLNPAITISTDMQRHIVWQSPGIINSTDILYGTTAMTGNFTEQPTNISNGNGYPSNYSPCISLANGKPVVSWTGYYDGNIWKITGEQEALNRKRAFVKVKGATGWGSFTELGDNVNFVNNNSVTSAAEKTVFVWSQGTTPQSKWVRRTAGAYGNIGNLSYSGIENQVSTGSDFNNMTAMVFNKQSLPYYFIKSTTNFSQDPIGGGIGKVGTLEQISYGRSGIVSKNGVEFVFNTGDVFVADSSVQFTFIADTLLFNSEEELNTAARTENFWLEEGVNFFFSNLYYVIRQELADSALKEQDQVNFKVELVKESNGEVIGTFDNITYNKNNLEKYANINYQVNCSGIQSGEYYLRLVTTVAGNAGYNLSNIQRDEFDLSKLNYVQVSFKGETIPVAYELSQNYPNPFNPSTTIRYQIPKEGMVTLKVYDILGAEVATLVNEEKIAGKYEVNFNASSLASGVYIYRLNVNDFVNVRKMVLVK